MIELEGYRVESILGEGGSGTVYAAVRAPAGDDSSARVAIKVLRADLALTDGETRRFLDEAALLHRIEHPHVVRVLASGRLPDGRPYLVMPRLDGETLAHRLQRAPLTVDEALALFDQLADAVAMLHGAGIIHRDLKPENVYIVDPAHVILLDFGIAKTRGAGPSTTTTEGRVRGTPAYMAPERFFTSPASIRSDIYELVVTLYEMLVGEVPWKDAEDLPARLNPDGSDIPPSLWAAMRPALNTHAQARPASVQELRDALARADALPVAIRTATIGRRPRALEEADTSPVATTTPVALPTKKKLGRYEIQDIIGSGGMGVVFRAFDPQLGRAVALKVVRPAEDGSVGDGTARLIREARAMAKIAHPNVIVVHDAGNVDDEVFIAMELVAGSNLAEWEKQRPRSWREIVHVYLQAARGLSAAHEAGLVHRDFKPHNTLVGTDDRVRVLDFGLARLPEEREAPRRASVPVMTRPSHPDLTATGAILGSPMYMSPEQHEGQPADARSDQFSFCVALFHALYGVKPFRGETHEELASSVTTGTAVIPSSAKGVPAVIGRALLRGLSRERRDRFGSMDDLIQILSDAYSRPRWPWIAAACAAIAILLVATVMVRPRASPAPVVTHEPGFDSNKRQVTFDDSDMPTLSPDGHRFAYSSDRGVIIRELATGKTVAVDEPRVVTDLRWSPVGDTICIAADSGARIITADGSPVRDVPIDGTACHCAWSPDGVRLLWHCDEDNTAFKTIDVATGAVRTVALPMPGVKKVLDMDWSRRGEVAIAGASRAGGELWFADIDNATAQRIAVDKIITDVRWSPRGDRIYYARTWFDGGEILFRDRQNPAFVQVATELPATTMQARAAFAIAPDERSLFYPSDGTHMEIVRFSAGSTTPRFITNDGQAKIALGVSPDGSELAYVAGPQDAERVYRQRFDGSAPIVVTGEVDAYLRLIYSPRGDELALISFKDHALHIHIATLATGKVREMRGPAVLTLDGLSWTDAGVTSRGDTGDLVVVDPAAGTLTTHALPLPAGTKVARFSRDGTHAAGTDATGRLVMIDAREGSSRVISSSGKAQMTPIGWSADGGWLYVAQSPNNVDQRLRALAISTTGDGAQRLLGVGAEGQLVEVLPDESLVQVTNDSGATIWVASRDRRATFPPETVAPISPPPSDAHYPALATLAVPGEKQLDGKATFDERFDATPYRGRRITLSFDARVTHSTLRATVTSGVYNDMKLSSGELEIGDSERAHHTVTADIAPDAVFIEIEMSAAEGGRAWISNLTLGGS
ncbi:MAG TPA: protein kinase [Kofleriaceae bacterium]|jgi:serine/threonine protein kinase